MFGGRELKPTTLLAVRLASMGSTLSANQGHGRCTHSRPHRGFWGVGHDGWTLAHGTSKDIPESLEARSRFPELCVGPGRPPCPPLDVVRPPLAWTLDDECAFRARVDLDDDYDGWHVQS
eukprot:7902417-Pyramimonas_sp.AAC.1